MSELFFYGNVNEFQEGSPPGKSSFFEQTVTIKSYHHVPLLKVQSKDWLQ